jgi:hypothetical protein
VQVATDVLWAVLSPQLALMMCQDRGWSSGDYADWLVDALDLLLLEPS